MSNAAMKIPTGLQIDTDNSLGQRANMCKETGEYGWLQIKPHEIFKGKMQWLVCYFQMA